MVTAIQLLNVIVILATSVSNSSSSAIITCPATKFPAIRNPIDKGLIQQLIISIGTMTGANHKGVPAGKKFPSHAKVKLQLKLWVNIL